MIEVLQLTAVVGAVLDQLTGAGIPAQGPVIAQASTGAGVWVAPPRLSTGTAAWAAPDEPTWTVDVFVVARGIDQAQVADMLTRADAVLAALADPDSPVAVTAASAIVLAPTATPAYQITCEN